MEFFRLHGGAIQVSTVTCNQQQRVNSRFFRCGSRPPKISPCWLGTFCPTLRYPARIGILIGRRASLQTTHVRQTEDCRSRKHLPGGCLRDRPERLQDRGGIYDSSYTASSAISFHPRSTILSSLSIRSKSISLTYDICPLDYLIVQVSWVGVPVCCNIANSRQLAACLLPSFLSNLLQFLPHVRPKA